MTFDVKLDVDHTDPLSTAELSKRAERANVRIKAVRQWRSPSGRGWHFLIDVEPTPTTAMETVALQLLFGSDVYREAYNLNRARVVDSGQASEFWRNYWNVLYVESG